MFDGGTRPTGWVLHRTAEPLHPHRPNACARPTGRVFVERQGTSPMITTAELPAVDAEAAPDKLEPKTPEIAVHAEEPASEEVVQTVEAQASIRALFSKLAAV